MTFCCTWAESQFQARHTVGSFMVAGPSEPGRFGFHRGYLTVHRKDWEDSLGANIEVQDALNAARISSIKLWCGGRVKFCAACGANLLGFYGSNGGALRDDDYTLRMGKQS